MSFLWWGKPKKWVKQYVHPHLTVYCEGVDAYRDWFERWENKYAFPNGDPERFTSWDAGWCWGKQSDKAGK